MLRAAALLAVFLAASPLRSGETLQVPYTMFRLKNGLTVVIHEDHALPVVTVNTWYHVGSARERPGRTGFAHLFEHIMFEGSKDVPKGAFDQWLEAVGGDNNASTSSDRTNYYEDAPSNALELPLFLESDRMAFLLDSMSPAKVDAQRDVVKNERRQHYENQPYGASEIKIREALYPPDHPYHWPTIGSMEDLTAASYEDVIAFFKRFYGPANASVVIAGDVDTKEAAALAENWFSDVPPSAPLEPLGSRPVVLSEEKRILLEDRVQLPRLYITWPTPPYLSPADAALSALGDILATGKTSRLYKKLVYDLQVAQDVSAAQDSQALCSAFGVVVTARAGHSLEEIRGLVDAEIEGLQSEAPTEHELGRVQNQNEAQLLSGLERIGGFGGRGDQMNSYLTAVGDPDYFQEDLARFRALSPSDIQAVAQTYLGRGRVLLSVVPSGQIDLALPGSTK
jgi:zinc protease